MTGTVFIGLAVTSHDASIMTNAVFSNGDHDRQRQWCLEG